MSDSSPSPRSGEPTADDVRLIKRRRSHAEQIADRCVHFTGMMNDACEAGVNYQSVRLDHAPVKYTEVERQNVPVYTLRRSFPCHQSMNFGGATCASCRFPTPEEVEAEEAESKRSIERMLKARAAIVEHIKATGKRGGTIDCPNCGAALGYSQASNGHIHARCAGEGCVAWME